MKMVKVASLLFALGGSPALAQQASPLVSAQHQEVVVIGERLRNVRFKMKRDGTTMAGSCRITRTSGDLVLDAMVCEAAVACMGTKKVSGSDFNSCMSPRWRALTTARGKQLQALRKKR